jgi:hypothetical protein
LSGTATPSTDAADDSDSKSSEFNTSKLELIVGDETIKESDPSELSSGFEVTRPYTA